MFLSTAREVVSCVCEKSSLIPSFFSSALESFTWVSREVPLAKVLFHQRHILAWDLLVVFCMVYHAVRSISQHARQNLGLALVLALYLLPRGVPAMESKSGGGAASNALALAATTTCIAGVAGAGSLAINSMSPCRKKQKTAGDFGTNTVELKLGSECFNGAAANGAVRYSSTISQAAILTYSIWSAFSTQEMEDL
jgi:hypothetical protein